MQSISPTALSEQKDIRVAAYCRVSTELEEQSESFNLQEQYYTRLILTTPGWQLAGIYADKGITGTLRSPRTGFQRMIRHCEEGKIQKIVCKSISRFARNTADLLETVRRLKELHIGVYFEKERMDTLSLQSEFVLSMIAAIAQDESRRISENMTWSFTRRFESGIPVFHRMLGYEIEGKGPDREIHINEKEAAIVREIFDLAVQGMGYKAIAEIMMNKGYLTFDGKSIWTIDRVQGILQNEKYTGNVLCQKTYTDNYLNHKTIINKGQKSKYLIENNHPAIISHEIFDIVQNRFENRKRKNTFTKKEYPLSGRVACGDCGSTFFRINSKEKGRWGCSRKMISKSLCDVETVKEEDIEIAMRGAFFMRYDSGAKKLVQQVKRDLRAIQDDDQIEASRMLKKCQLEQLRQKELCKPVDEQLLAGEQRIRIEKELEQQEEFWALLEKDRKYRKNTLLWLDHFPCGTKGREDFLQELNIEYLRAWLIRITIVSPMLFKIVWFDSKETIVDLNPGTREENKAG